MTLRVTRKTRMPKRGTEDSSKGRPIGLRAAIRAVLLESHKLDLGCPTEEKCQLIVLQGLTACGGCSKYVDIPIPEFDTLLITRLKLVVRWESLVNVGCKFGPNDLSPRQWNDLIMLAQERQYVDEQIRRLRDGGKGSSKLPGDATVRLVEGRKKAGIPGPGQSLFGSGR